MDVIREYKVKRIIQGRIPKGEDLFKWLTEKAKELNIKAGMVSGIGAVTKATIGYYDQIKREYIIKNFNQPMEILSLKGNISVKDGVSFAHLHVVLGKEDFTAIGGHLFEGSEVFAFEFEIVEFEGEAFTRGFDDQTGLYLWQKT
ncbi:DNA-binding protein [Thermodesulfobacterium sp. TA1]|uniref:PPC domain-containing DNA-binding protein n=1 Tax=Thermodesulfobacterium sp. TA1 TaxID=2234087 RepID=UPI001231ED3B|nr:PPC domain-containing DNA-binding protein [Thermodesulfobacterium sp. TA1]QER42746.1 DNA-binding protein [Thermodesulfobacterium sp. TA1]